MHDAGHANRAAMETVINGKAPLREVKEILARAALLAEDFYLATGCMTLNQQGLVWMDAKRCFMDVRFPGSNNGMEYKHQANRLREIAELADQCLAMDPWTASSDS